MSSASPRVLDYMMAVRAMQKAKAEMVPGAPEATLNGAVARMSQAYNRLGSASRPRNPGDEIECIHGVPVDRQCEQGQCYGDGPLYQPKVPSILASTDALSFDLATAREALRTIRSLVLPGPIMEACIRGLEGSPPHAPVTEETRSGEETLASLNADARWHLQQIREHADHIGSRTIVALAEAALRGGGK